MNFGRHTLVCHVTWPSASLARRLLLCELAINLVGMRAATLALESTIARCTIEMTASFRSMRSCQRPQYDSRHEWRCGPRSRTSPRPAASAMSPGWPRSTDRWPALVPAALGRWVACNLTSLRRAYSFCRASSSRAAPSGGAAGNILICSDGSRRISGSIPGNTRLRSDDRRVVIDLSRRTGR